MRGRSGWPEKIGFFLEELDDPNRLDPLEEIGIFAQNLGARAPYASLA
jgi:hypothetical protein